MCPKGLGAREITLVILYFNVFWIMYFTRVQDYSPLPKKKSTRTQEDIVYVIYFSYVFLVGR